MSGGGTIYEYQRELTAKLEQVMQERDRLRNALESIREDLLEDEDCDCPPEWPRCSSCRTHLRIQLALGKKP